MKGYKMIIYKCDVCGQELSENEYNGWKKFDYPHYRGKIVISIVEFRAPDDYVMCNDCVLKHIRQENPEGN